MKKFNYTDHSEVTDVELSLVEDCADCPSSELDISEINEFLDEGYTSKEAKKIATEESDEIYSESEDFAYSLASSEDRDDT